MNRVKATALAAALAIGAAVPALAQTDAAGAAKTDGAHAHERMWRGQRGGDGFFADLGLSDAQRTQIQQIRQNHEQVMRPLEDEVRAKRREIAQLSHGTTFDEALVKQKLTESAAVEAKLMGERFKLHQETLGVLTAEQRAKLDQKREQFKSRRAERHQSPAAEPVQ